MWQQVVFPVPTHSLPAVQRAAFLQHATLAAATNNPLATYALAAHSWWQVAVSVNRHRDMFPSVEAMENAHLSKTDMSQAFSTKMEAALIDIFTKMIADDGDDDLPQWSLEWVVHSTTLQYLWLFLVALALVRLWGEGGGGGCFFHYM